MNRTTIPPTPDPPRKPLVWKRPKLRTRYPETESLVNPQTGEKRLACRETADILCKTFGWKNLTVVKPTIVESSIPNLEEE